MNTADKAPHSDALSPPVRDEHWPLTPFNDAEKSDSAPPLSMFHRGVIAKLPIADLRAITESLLTLTNVACGLASQPRFTDRRGFSSEAGHVLLSLNGAFDWMVEAIGDELAGRDIEDPEEFEDFIWCRLAIKAAMEPNVGRFAAYAGELSDCLEDLQQAGSAEAGVQA